MHVKNPGAPSPRATLPTAAEKSVQGTKAGQPSAPPRTSSPVPGDSVDNARAEFSGERPAPTGVPGKNLLAVRAGARGASGAEEVAGGGAAGGPQGPALADVKTSYYDGDSVEDLINRPWPPGLDQHLKRCEGPEVDYASAMTLLDPKYRSRKSGNYRGLWGHEVSSAEVGVYTKNGRPSYRGPGRYPLVLSRWKMNKKGTLEYTKDINGSDQKAEDKYNKTKLFDVKDGQVAVVLFNGKNVLLGPGRYAADAQVNIPEKWFLNLTSLEKETDVGRKQPQEEMNARPAPTPVTGQKRRLPAPPVPKTLLSAGRNQQLGGYTFLRPGPGYVAMKQHLDGTISMTRGLMIIHPNETPVKTAQGKDVTFGDTQSYISDVDLQELTTKDFFYPKLSLTVRWQIDDPGKWLKLKGGFETPEAIIFREADAKTRDWLLEKSYEQARQAQEHESNELIEHVQQALAKVGPSWGFRVDRVLLTALTCPDVEEQQKGFRDLQMKAEKNKREKAALAPALELIQQQQTNAALESTAEQTAERTKIEQAKLTQDQEQAKETALVEAQVDRARKQEMYEVETENQVAATKRQIELANAENNAAIAAQNAAGVRLTKEAEAYGVQRMGQALAENPAVLEQMRIAAFEKVGLAMAEAAKANPNIYLTADQAMHNLRVDRGQPGIPQTQVVLSPAALIGEK